MVLVQWFKTNKLIGGGADDKQQIQKDTAEICTVCGLRLAAHHAVCDINKALGAATSPVHCCLVADKTISFLHSFY